MNLDAYGLPEQADGDNLDQLNRVGILALSDFEWHLKLASLRDDNGIHVRHIGANPNNVSGDQLVPPFASYMKNNDYKFHAVTRAMLRRLGFAQNTHDTTPGKRKFLPDFLLHRVIMFIARVYAPTDKNSRFVNCIGHTIVCLADTVLFLNTLVTVIDLRIRNNPDHVDPFVNAVATLYSCNVYRPTWLSKLSARMLEAGAIITLGGLVSGTELEFSKVAGGLVHYHRAASGGNPEVGEVQVGHWTETLKIARS